jgi:hypothetical protein
MLDDEDEIQTQKRIRFEEVSKLVPKKLVLNTLTMLILFFWMNQNQLEHPNKYLQLLNKFCSFAIQTVEFGIAIDQGYTYLMYSLIVY